MRRRSERKKSTEVASPPPVLKRSGRRSQRSSSQADSRKSSKTEEANVIADVVNEESKDSISVAETLSNNGELSERSSLPPEDDIKKETTNDQPLETIAEMPVEQSDETQIKNETSNDSQEANTIENKPEESRQSPESHTEEVQNLHKETTPIEKSPEQSSNEVSSEEKELPKTEELLQSDVVSNIKQNYLEENTKQNEINEDPPKESQKEIEKIKSPEKIENSVTSSSSSSVNEHKKTFSRNRERRSQLASIKQQKEKEKDERGENDENEEFNNNSEKLSSTPSLSKEKTQQQQQQQQNTRKRRWLSKKTTDSKSQILAISTDSLKNLISDVHPVPLSDVKLESSSDVEEIESEREEGEASPTPVKVRTEKSSIFDREHKPSSKTFEQPMRKISVLNDRDEHSAPIPTRNATSCILYITNLVRPFTVLQLKGLLARTGKIVENRFWIDKIKSKCFVEYETEDEAIETRHALHGVRWPTSNPKCLNVDFGSVNDMEKAMASTQDSGPQFGQDIGRENRLVGTGWDRDRFDFEEKKIQVGRPVREWDVGKREEIENESHRAKEREKMRSGERGERVIHNDRVDRDSLRNKDRSDKDRDRKRRSTDREHRRSFSASPARKIKKKNNDPPLRLLDDLFRKTKTTPCIYWLPLTPEQIAEKEAFRLRRVAEHQERVRLRELEKEKMREKEREREREREKERNRRERDRSIGHRRSNSRDRRRY